MQEDAFRVGMKVLGKIDSERSCFGVIADPNNCKGFSPSQREKLSDGNVSVIRVYCYCNGEFQEAKGPPENTLEVVSNDGIKSANHLHFFK